MPHTLSIVIVNWNGEKYLDECLDSVGMEAASSTGVDICVVDNASTDGSVSMVSERYPDVRLIQLTENRGFAAGVNAGIKATAGDIVVLVNNDATMALGALAAMMAPFEEEQNVGAVTGCVLLADLRRPAEPGEAALVDRHGRRWAVADGRGSGAVRLVNSTGNVVTTSGNGQDRDWLTPLDELRADEDVFGFSGGAVALRRTALHDVGLFDESLFMYYEDTDLSWRLRRRQWDIRYANGARFLHRHAASSGTTSELFLRHNARNRMLVAVRHAPVSVAVRALGHGVGRAFRGIGSLRGTRRSAWVLGQVLIRLPRELGRRRQMDRRATCSRSAIARRYLISD